MKRLWVLSIMLFVGAVAHAAPKEVVIGVIADGPETLNRIDIYKQRIVEALDSEKHVPVFPESSTLSADHSLSQVSSQLRTLQADKTVDIVLALGPVSAKAADLAAKGRLGLNKPVFAPIVIDAKVQGLGRNRVQNKSNLRNFHFLDIPYAITNDLDAFAQILEFKRLAIFVDESIVSANSQIVFSEHFSKRFPRIDKLDVIAVGSSGEQTLARLGSMPEAYQAIYLTELSTMSPKERMILIKGLNQLQKPTFSMKGKVDVESGALASLVSVDLDDRRAIVVAQNILKSLGGEKLQNMPIHYNVDNALTVNMKTSKALGLSPPWSVISEANMIGGANGNGYLKPSQMAEAESLEGLGLSISEAIKSASNNPKLAAMQSQLAEKGHEYIQARAAYLPQLNAALNGRLIDADRAEQAFQIEPEHLVNGGLLLSQTLWSSDDKLAMDLIKTEQAVVSADLLALQQELSLDAGSAYLALIYARSVESVLRARLNRVRNYRDSARRLSDRDPNAEADIFRMETVAAHAKKEILLSQSTSRQLEILFNQILGRSLQAPVNTAEQDLLTAGLHPLELRVMSYVKDPRSFPAFSDALSQMLLDKNADLARYDARKQSAQVALAGEKRAQYSPDVQLYAGMSYDIYRTPTGQYADLSNYNNLLSTLDSEASLDPNQSYSYTEDYAIQMPKQRDFLNWEAGLSVKFPLFTGLKRKGIVDQRKAALITLSHQRRGAAAQVESKLRGALVNLNASHQAISFADDSRKAALRGLKLTAEQYDKGIRPLVDFNAASEDSLKAELNHIQAIYEFRQNFLRVFSLLNALDIYGDETKQTRFFGSLDKLYKERGYIIPKQR